HEAPEDLLRWAHNFAGQVHDRSEELARLAPWLGLLREQGAEKGSDPQKSKGSDPFSAPEAGTPPADLAGWILLRERLTGGAGVGEWNAQREPLLAEWAASPGPVAAGLSKAIQEGSAPRFLVRCQELADRAAVLAAAMDFKLLYNQQRHLFSIGYNLAINRLDNAHYD